MRVDAVQPYGFHRVTSMWMEVVGPSAQVDQTLLTLQWGSKMTSCSPETKLHSRAGGPSVSDLSRAHAHHALLIRMLCILQCLRVRGKPTVLQCLHVSTRVLVRDIRRLDRCCPQWRFTKPLSHPCSDPRNASGDTHRRPIHKVQI